MEYYFKHAEAADMCQRIISVIAGKYIDKLLESNGRLEISITQPHAEDLGKKIIIDVSKDADATIKAMPLNAIKRKDGGGTMGFYREVFARLLSSRRYFAF